MAQDCYRVGVIGGGRMGTVHARGYACNPRTEVVAVADTDEEVRRLFCERFECRGYETYEEMLKSEELDIAAPILPVRANAGAVRAAAHAGVRAIFCEKPLTARLADADAMIAACEQNDVVIAAGLVAKNRHVFWDAKRHIDAGIIGKMRCINIYCRNNQGGCHGINLARHFADYADVEWVIGWVSGDPHGDHEEAYEEGQRSFGQIGGHIRFANGVDVYSHFQVPWKGIEVIGTHGSLFSEQTSSRDLFLLKGNENGDNPPRKWRQLHEIPDAYVHEPARANSDGSPVRDEDGWLPVSLTMRDSLRTLVNALDRGASVNERLEMTTGQDLRVALEICIAMRESARCEHVPVRLPLRNRALLMYPKKSRWYYKKEIHGEDWYRDALANYQQLETRT